mmetsp:Transcript_2466/g.7207  ORF Transcript_2466/g.7207 Transcript_2466/m.7207 type:complete len:254 (+) Transcript_2466:157-918(+)
MLLTSTWTAATPSPTAYPSPQPSSDRIGVCSIGTDTALVIPITITITKTTSGIFNSQRTEGAVRAKRRLVPAAEGGSLPSPASPPSGVSPPRTPSSIRSDSWDGTSPPPTSPSTLDFGRSGSSRSTGGATAWRTARPSSHRRSPASRPPGPWASSRPRPDLPASSWPCPTATRTTRRGGGGTSTSPCCTCWRRSRRGSRLSFITSRHVRASSGSGRTGPWMDWYCFMANASAGQAASWQSWRAAATWSQLLRY